MAPSVGGSRPAIRRSRVDLPHPDGPTRATNSPSATSSVIPLSACTPSFPGKVIPTSFRAIAVDVAMPSSHRLTRAPETSAGRELVPEPGPHLGLTQERGIESRPLNLGEFLLGETKEILQQRELVRDRGPRGHRVVVADGDRNASVVQPPHRVTGDSGD